jgi:hypothetical protein
VKTEEIVASIGYCGLICGLCHLAKDCSGCKSETNRCARYLSETGCYQYNCCKERNLKGCWECVEFSCGKDMFSESHDLRLRAFVRFIRDEGLEKFAGCIIRNEINGIRYGYQKDYDGLASEEAVIELLKTGERDEER